MKVKCSLLIVLAFVLYLSGFSSVSAKSSTVYLNKTSVETKKGKTVTLRVKKAKGITIKKTKFSVLDGNEIISVTKKGVVTAKGLGLGTVMCNVKYKKGKKVKSVKLKSYINVSCPHNYVEKVFKEATCTEDGSEGEECKLCGNTRKVKTIKAKGHQYEHTKVEATCSKDGYDLYVCEVCKDEYRENEVKATGKHEIDLSKVHYYNSVGLSDETGKYYDKGQYQHRVKGTCRECGNEVEILEKCEFDVVEEEGTCTEPGLRYSKCALCGEKKDEVQTEPKGHTWSGSFTEIPATCTTEGKRSVKCEVCGADKPDSITTIPFLPHTFEDTVISQSDCTHAEVSLSVCTVCSTTEEHLTRQALGHTDYDENGYCDTCDEPCSGVFDSNGEFLYSWQYLMENCLDTGYKAYKSSTYEFLVPKTEDAVEVNVGTNAILYIPKGYNISNEFLKSFKGLFKEIYLDPNYCTVSSEDDSYVILDEAFNGVDTLHYYYDGLNTLSSYYGAKSGVGKSVK